MGYKLTPLGKKLGFNIYGSKVLDETINNLKGYCEIQNKFDSLSDNWAIGREMPWEDFMMLADCSFLPRKEANKLDDELLDSNNSKDTRKIIKKLKDLRDTCDTSFHVTKLGHKISFNIYGKILLNGLRANLENLIKEQSEENGYLRSIGKDPYETSQASFDVSLDEWEVNADLRLLKLFNFASKSLLHEILVEISDNRDINSLRQLDKKIIYAYDSLNGDE